MELFKLLGTIAIDNSDAKKALGETSSKAKETADTIRKSNKTTQDSNKSTGTTFGNLKAKVNEYKAQGLSTSQAWRQANADMKGSTEDAGNGMVSAFKKVGAAVATFLAVDAIKNFGLSCVQAAADANAASSQFTQVFGDLESKAQGALSKIADEAGITENRMKGSFTKIAAFAKTTGMDTESALSLTERAMVAVADSAAFYDRSLEETTESLQSFLKGNYENDSALGLSCTEITRNEAANKLYGKSFKDLSESQKQLTLLKMVEDANKLSGAMGQAARESDTWKNVTGNLQQAWKDFQAVIGKNILPGAVKAVKGMVGAIEDLTAKVPAAVEWVKTHKTELGGLALVAGAFVTAIGLYSKGLTFAAIKTSIMAGASSALAGIMGFITSPITLTVLAIGALAAAFVVAYKKSETFREFVNKLKDGLVQAFGKVKESAIAVKDWLVDAWDEISTRCAPLVSAIKENLIGAFEDLKEKGQALKEKLIELKDKFQPIADFLSGAFSDAVSNATTWIEDLKNKVVDFSESALTWLNDKITEAREGFDKFCEFAGRLWENLDPLVTLIRDNLLNALEGLDGPIQTIKDAFKNVGEVVKNDLLPALKEHLLPLWEALKPVLGAVAGVLGGALVTGIGLAIGALNGIISAVSGFAEMFSGLVEIVGGVFELIVGLFSGNGELIQQSLDKIWQGVCDCFGGLWDAVSGFLQGFVDGVVGFFTGLWDTLVGHSIVPDTINGVINCFGGLWDGVKGFLSDFVGNVVSGFLDLKDKAVEKFTELKDKAVEKFGELKDKAGEKWESIKSTISEKASGLKDKATTAFSTLKEKASSLASGTKEKAVSAWNGLKDKTSSLFGAAKDKASSLWSELKGKITGDSSTAEQEVGSKFGSLKNKVSSAVEQARNSAKSAFDIIKSTISGGAGGAFDAVSNKFGLMGTKIKTVMTSALAAVVSGIDSMKSKFNFSWSLPKIKLPHFSISGKFSLNPPSIPKFSVSWYKKAMENAMILNQPTIFGYSAASGRFLGGGEAGNEVVAGQGTLMSMIQTAVAMQNEALAYYLQRLLELLADYFPQVLEAMDNPRPAVFDPNSAAAAMAVPMNYELGKIAAREGRRK